MEEYYLTKEGLEKLKQESEELKKKRPEIAQRLQESAAFGDLSENAEYQEAKVAQAFIEGRILELEEILRNAVIIEKGRKAKTIQLGSKVVLASTEGRKETFIIVGASEALPEEGKISDESPLGRALLGKEEGNEVEVDAPRGRKKYKIVTV